MVSLASVGARFEVALQVIEGGVGEVRGVLSETEQTSQPSYVFVQPRHVLRVRPPSALRAGMVVRTPMGEVYLVGDNGPSEQADGALWQSYRLFEATGRYSWKRRTRIKDPITKADKEGPLEDLGLIWAALEVLDRTESDREIRIDYTQSRFISGVAVARGDLIDNRSVSRVDRQLGLAIGIVT
jgi:hypothetical protein